MAENDEVEKPKPPVDTPVETPPPVSTEAVALLDTPTTPAKPVTDDTKPVSYNAGDLYKGQQSGVTDTPAGADRVDRERSPYRSPAELQDSGLTNIEELKTDEFKEELPPGQRRFTGTDPEGRGVDLRYTNDQLTSSRTTSVGNDGRTTAVTSNYGDNGNGSVDTTVTGKDGKEESRTNESYEGGRLRSQSESRTDATTGVRTDTSAKFDDKGNPVSESTSTFRRDGTQASAREMTYGPDGTRETTATFDEKGQRSEEKFKHTGPDGKLVQKVESTFEDGEKEARTRIQSDYVNGNLDKKTLTERTGNGDEGLTSVTSYDHKTGNMKDTTTTFTNKAGHTIEQHRQNYDADENLVGKSRDVYDGKGGKEPVSSESYTYDKKGNTLTETFKEREGGKTTETHNKYTYSGDALTGRNSTTSVSDRNGRQVTETATTYDPKSTKGDPTPTSQTVTQRNYNPDKTQPIDLKTGERRYEATPATSSVAKQEFKDGKLVSQHQDNYKGDVGGAPTGSSDTTYAYNKDGTIKSSETKNSDGSVSNTSYDRTGTGEDLKTTVKTVNRSSADGPITSTETAVSDANGNPISKTVKHADGRRSDTVYSRTGTGHDALTTAETTHSKDGKPLSIDKSVTDAHGTERVNQRTEFQYGKDGKFESMKMAKTTFDHEGNQKLHVEATINKDGGGNFKLEEMKDGKLVQRSGDVPAGTLNKLSRTGDFSEAMHTLKKIGEGDYMTGLRNLAVLGGNKGDLALRDTENMGAKLQRGIDTMRTLAKDKGTPGNEFNMDGAIEHLRSLSGGSIEKTVSTICDMGKGKTEKDLAAAREKLFNTSLMDPKTGKLSFDAFAKNLAGYLDAAEKHDKGDAPEGLDFALRAGGQGRDLPGGKKAGTEGKTDGPKLGECLDGICKLAKAKTDGGGPDGEKPKDLAKGLDIIVKANGGKLEGAETLLDPFGGVVNAADNLVETTNANSPEQAIKDISTYGTGTNPDFRTACRHLDTQATAINERNGLAPGDTGALDVMAMTRQVSTFTNDGIRDFGAGSRNVTELANHVSPGNFDAGVVQISSIHGNGELASVERAGAYFREHSTTMKLSSPDVVAAGKDFAAFVPRNTDGTPGQPNLEVAGEQLRTLQTSYSQASGSPVSLTELTRDIAHLPSHTTPNLSAAAAIINDQSRVTGLPFAAAGMDLAQLTSREKPSMSATGDQAREHMATMPAGSDRTMSGALADMSRLSDGRPSLAAAGDNIRSHMAQMPPGSDFSASRRDIAAFGGGSMTQSAENLRAVNAPSLSDAMRQVSTSALVDRNSDKPPLTQAHQQLSTINPTNIPEAIRTVQAASPTGTFQDGARQVASIGVPQFAAQVNAAHQEGLKSNPNLQPSDVVRAAMAAGGNDLARGLNIVARDGVQAHLPAATPGVTPGATPKGDVTPTAVVKDTHTPTVTPALDRPAPVVEKLAQQPTSPTTPTHVQTPSNDKPLTPPKPLDAVVQVPTPKTVDPAKSVTPNVVVAQAKDAPATPGVLPGQVKPLSSDAVVKAPVVTSATSGLAVTKADVSHPATPVTQPATTPKPDVLTKVSPALDKPLTPPNRPQQVDVVAKATTDPGVKVLNGGTYITTTSTAMAKAAAAAVDAARVQALRTEAGAAQQQVQALKADKQAGIGKELTDARKLAQGNVTALTQMSQANDSGRRIGGAKGIAIGRGPGTALGFGLDGRFVGYGGAAGAEAGKGISFVARGWKSGGSRALPGVEIAIAAILMSGGIARKRRLQAGKKGEAGSTGSAEDEALNGEGGEVITETSNDDNLQKVQQYQILTRPTWLVRHGEDLCRLAEHLFEDASLGWLIADLNISSSKQSWMDGKRIVELKVRQRLELPVWQDIVEFHKRNLTYAKPENLITIVTETSIESDLVHSALATVMGADQVPVGARPIPGIVAARRAQEASGPAVPAALRQGGNDGQLGGGVPAALRSGLPISGGGNGMPPNVGPTAVATAGGTQNLDIIKGKLAASRAEIDALLSSLRRNNSNDDTNNPGTVLAEKISGDDDGPSASAPITEDDKPVLKPKFV